MPKCILYTQCSLDIYIRQGTLICLLTLGAEKHAFTLFVGIWKGSKSEFLLLTFKHWFKQFVKCVFMCCTMLYQITYTDKP